jgi:hypothetical protein
VVPRSWEISPTTVGDACRLAIWILGRETLQVGKATGLCQCEICDCFQPSGEGGLAKERSNEHKSMRQCNYVFFSSLIITALCDVLGSCGRPCLESIPCWVSAQSKFSQRTSGTWTSGLKLRHPDLPRTLIRHTYGPEP